MALVGRESRDYENVDLEILEEVVAKHLPVLRSALTKALSDAAPQS